MFPTTRWRDPMSLELIRDYLSYDPETGVFRWAAKPRGRGYPYRVGDEAGTIDVRGYRVIRFRGVLYYAHRLAWFFAHGTMPERIDHRNCVKSDNRISNLRLATQQQNAANSNTKNRKKARGAYFRRNKGKWQGAIGLNGRFIHLGYFETEKDAAIAYDAAAVHHFGEFAHLNFRKEDTYGRTYG